MAYCSNCGEKIDCGMKFCPECGYPASMREESKKYTHEGKIHKCPNCGEILDAFVSNCPSCNYELRGDNSLKSFLEKLERTETREKKAILIRNFPMTNTKEDIFEFMILASSNIAGESDETIFNAWCAKFEQCYQKAKLSFSGDVDFEKIQQLYSQTVEKAEKEKTIHGVNKVGSSVSIFLKSLPNPIFGIVVVLLGVYEATRIVKGDFAGIDIIMVALILWPIYKISNKKGKK